MIQSTKVGYYIKLSTLCEEALGRVAVVQRTPSILCVEVFRLLRIELDEFGPADRRFLINHSINHSGTAMIISIRCL